MLNYKFSAQIKNGQIVVSELWQTKFSDHLKSLEGCKVDITVSKIKEHEIRSNQQNKYYRGVILHLLSEHTGYTEEEIHEILKQKFLGCIVSFGRQTYNVGKSTTELDTIEMTEYMDRIRMWSAAEFGLSIPEPQEVEYA